MSAHIFRARGASFHHFASPATSARRLLPVCLEPRPGPAFTILLPELRQLLPYPRRYATIWRRRLPSTRSCGHVSHVVCVCRRSECRLQSWRFSLRSTHTHKTTTKDYVSPGHHLRESAFGSGGRAAAGLFRRFAAAPPGDGGGRGSAGRCGGWFCGRLVDGDGRRR